MANQQEKDSIKQLHAKRGGLKTQLTLLEKTLNNINKDELNNDLCQNLKQRLLKIEPIYDKFNDMQSEIENLRVGDQTSLNDELLERENFENKYFELISKLKTILSSNDQTQTMQANLSNSDSQSTKCSVKLPTLNLTTFDGTFTAWRSFFDSFKTLIDNNHVLSNAQKLAYLKSALKGEPHNLISTLETIDTNYSIALDILKNRYDNKRRIVSNHVQAILGIGSVLRESPSHFRDLINTLQTHLNCLRSLGQPIDNWDAILVPIIISKVDNNTVKEWETKLNNVMNNEYIPTLDELLKFLTTKLNTLEVTSKHSDTKSQSNQSIKARSSFTLTEGQLLKCQVCDGHHTIFECDNFNKLDVEAKNKRARDLRLCINCLRKGHFINDCKSISRCRLCRKKHHTLLHINKNNKAENTNEPIPKVVSTNCSSVNNYSQTILSTAQVGVKPPCNMMFKVRALLDSASQSHFISKSLCQKLKLKAIPYQMNITGIGKSSINITEYVELIIYSIHNKFQLKIKCLVVSEITNALPSITFNANLINIPANIKLADRDYNIAQPIDLLLGANVFWSLLCVGQIKQKGIIFQKTKFGWVISGQLFRDEYHINKGATFLSLDDLNKKIERFWQIDEFISQNNKLTNEEVYCENYFTETTERDENGKFIVKIPLKNSADALGESYNIAKNRFLALEKRLENDKSLKTEYSKFINEYIDLHHMSPINTISLNNYYYFPHHCVIKENSETTRLRVVFDGSSKTSNGLSFNDIQCKGPVLQDDIFSIMARFRLYQYVLTADIEKMYRQVWVHEDHRKFQRILWRENPNETLKTYELNTVTYGTTCAPYLAVRCLTELANEHQNEFPIESQIIRNDFYVDDLITGSNNLSDLRVIKSNVIKILQTGGFNLRKFYSNVNELNDEGVSSQKKTKLTTGVCKTLGVNWDPSMDLFSYAFNFHTNESEVTKRSILSMTAQLYDPLGLLTPIIITAKLIIQELWRVNLSWDESIPMHLHTSWVNFKENMKHINEIYIHRHVLIKNFTKVELHAFSDSSERAYGSCIYLKSINNQNEFNVSLLASKSRVAPLKQTTLPRLELCSAVLSAQLASKFKGILRIHIDQEFYYSDSEITLCWIKSKQYKWKNYVANRVGEIQNLTNINDWYYVKSEHNPADLITRGISAKKLIKANLWWQGPDWLTSNISQLTTCPITIQDPPEVKTNIQTFHVATQDEMFPINNFSSITRLKRVFAYCSRFLSNTRKSKTNRQYGPLTVNELSEALIALVRIVQITSFPEEYKQLLKGLNIKSSSKILSLAPFMSNDKIIRVGGRLRLSEFNYNKKHPIVLPQKNYLTDLIIKHEHKVLMHAGTKATLNSVRENFWPISGTNTTKRIIRNCISCFKHNAKPVNQIMGNLPKERIQIRYPFHTTGVDYAGPYSITNRKGRGHKTITNGYICLFICFTTKCIHLELVTSLNTDSFLQSFKRFIARRGKPLNVMSDNGTNFVGASNELASLGRFLNDNVDWFKESTASLGINWSFIPPRAPNFGGLWEAGVKSVKHHLKRILNNTLLTYEEFNTLLIQIEAILNSRPLCSLSNDPNDLEPLTPAHFLIGRSFMTIPDPDLLDVPENRLNRFQMLQKLNQQFWRKWSKEYIGQLTQRTKWKDGVQQIQNESLVILKEDNAPPACWRLARVKQLHPGPDGVVRVVTLKTTSGEFKRAVNSICVLPIET